MSISKNDDNVNCQICVYFYVTWDPSFPRGCRLYGFKSTASPAAMVREATGGKCQNYVKKKFNCQPYKMYG